MCWKLGLFSSTAAPELTENPKKRWQRQPVTSVTYGITVPRCRAGALTAPRSRPQHPTITTNKVANSLRKVATLTIERNTNRSLLRLPISSLSSPPVLIVAASMRSEATPTINSAQRVAIPTPQRMRRNPRCNRRSPPMVLAGMCAKMRQQRASIMTRHANSAAMGNGSAGERWGIGGLAVTPS
ncbi:hypothetical protein BD410DRAFT_802151 [Rickenella mellea]|uniref:Uncharacterized protein n=1 Tax=Rickenella mellea TaxID=50990 RepID=A0A4Y7QAM9_9AGAM|nr:hypothetical protein BD410DRAFT_802151 [Rickenella mellea]